MYVSPQLTDAARKSGIRGAVSKTGISQLTKGVEAVLRDEMYFDLPLAS
jgi:hypothetical protein